MLADLRVIASSDKNNLQCLPAKPPQNGNQTSASSAFRFRGQQDVASDKVEKNGETDKRKHSEQIRPGTIEERIVRACPFLERIEPLFPRDGEEGEEHAGECAACDVTGGEENAVALVAFRDELIFGQSCAPACLRRVYLSTSQRTMPPT